jgi:hypothetical protein
MNYNIKYLKYKAKYLKLKREVMTGGGGEKDNNNDKINNADETISVTKEEFEEDQKKLILSKINNELCVSGSNTNCQYNKNTNEIILMEDKNGTGIQ